jgi:hypothetical protein
MEKRIYVYCRYCKCHFSLFFKGFKRCPLSGYTHKLTVCEVEGHNLPQWMEV